VYDCSRAGSINQTADVLRNALAHLASFLDGIEFTNAACTVEMQLQPLSASPE
jgi:hypothetical protein